MSRKTINTFSSEVLKTYATTLQLFIWGVSETKLLGSVRMFENLDEYEECEGINMGVSFIKENTREDVHIELMSVMKKITNEIN